MAPKTKATAAKLPEVKTISCELSKGTQALTLLELGEFGGYKVQITIKRDPYEFQSSARISVWRLADLSWQSVASIPGSCMKTRSIYGPTPLAVADFAADRAELLRRFAAIVL